MDIPPTLEEARAAMQKLHMERKAASLAGDAPRVLSIRYEMGALSQAIRRMQQEEARRAVVSGA